MTLLRNRRKSTLVKSWKEICKMKLTKMCLQGWFERQLSWTFIYELYENICCGKATSRKDWYGLQLTKHGQLSNGERWCLQMRKSLSCLKTIWGSMFDEEEKRGTRQTVFCRLWSVGEDLYKFGALSHTADSSIFNKITIPSTQPEQ